MSISGIIKVRYIDYNAIQKERANYEEGTIYV